jgi:hypothetical protein
MSMDRKQILEEFLKNIACMANKEYQERVWVRAEGPECQDIDDSIGDFFDEDFVIKEYKDFKITNDQIESLLQLHKKLRIFTDTYGVHYPYKSTQKLISMPEWEEIRCLAKNILEVFKYELDYP